MNIFATSNCPIESARYLDDKRVVKMCLETAQILSTALRFYGVDVDYIYKSTHVNHPANVWARETRMNYLWTVRHLQALCKEYTKRYNKEHKCEKMVLDFTMLAYKIPSGFQTQFANCAANAGLGITYKHISDVHTAYKLYLIDRWYSDVRTPTWYGKTKTEVAA